jgi:flagellar biosynthesis/type III secretory pathway protein FliH
MRSCCRRINLFHDLAYADLSEPARIALEKLMATLDNFQFQSEFAKKYIALGREEGRREVREEGRQEGFAKGFVEGFVRGLLVALESRGLSISEQVQTRIHACTEIKQLDAWIRKVASVDSVDELFFDELHLSQR